MLGNFLYKGMPASELTIPQLYEAQEAFFDHYNAGSSTQQTDQMADLRAYFYAHPWKTDLKVMSLILDGSLPLPHSTALPPNEIGCTVKAFLGTTSPFPVHPWLDDLKVMA